LKNEKASEWLSLESVLSHQQEHTAVTDRREPEAAEEGTGREWHKLKET